MLNKTSRKPPAAGHGCGKFSGYPSHPHPAHGRVQVVYREPVRGPVRDVGFNGKSLMLTNNLIDFFHKFFPFRLPIKMPMFRVMGIPGIFQ
jgi:hypothetical protein